MESSRAYEIAASVFGGASLVVAVATSALPGGLPTTMYGMAVLVGGLPYLLMAVGRLVPRKQVDDLWALYHRSEDAREKDRETVAATTDAIEALSILVRTALPPPREASTHDPPP